MIGKLNSTSGPSSTVQTLNAFRDPLLGATVDELPRLAKIIFVAVASHRVGDRPNRCEPRAVKRRPKEYARLMKPRAELRTASRPARWCRLISDERCLSPRPFRRLWRCQHASLTYCCPEFLRPPEESVPRALSPAHQRSQHR